MQRHRFALRCRASDSCMDVTELRNGAVSALCPNPNRQENLAERFGGRQFVMDSLTKFDESQTESLFRATSSQGLRLRGLPGASLGPRTHTFLPKPMQTKNGLANLREEEECHGNAPSLNE